VNTFYSVNIRNSAAGPMLEALFDASRADNRKLFTKDLLFFQSDGNVDIFIDGEKLCVTPEDFVYIKSSDVDSEGTCLLAHVLHAHDVPFSDPVNLSTEVVTDKSFQSIVLPLRNVAFPRSLVGKRDALLANEQLVRDLFGDQCVIKAAGRKGQSVAVCDLTSPTSFSDTLEEVVTDENAYKLITVQEVVDKRCDFRVLVVRKEVIGRLKKCSDSLLTHFTYGGVNEEFAESDDRAAIDALAVSATSAAGYTVGGVDIVNNAGTLQVFEVNKNPGMHGLEKQVKERFLPSLIGPEM